MSKFAFTPQLDEYEYLVIQAFDLAHYELLLPEHIQSDLNRAKLMRALTSLTKKGLITANTRPLRLTRRGIVLKYQIEQEKNELS